MDMNVSIIMQYLTAALTGIGILAFVVAAITQAIKDLPRLSTMPTSAVALVISLILCPVALVAICQYYNVVITWYMVFASFIAAFMVYLVSTGGWDALNKIWQRTKFSKDA